MDFEGQLLSELLGKILLTLGFCIAFGWAYLNGDIRILLAGGWISFITALLVFFYWLTMVDFCTRLSLLQPQIKQVAIPLRLPFHNHPESVLE
jgi:hypothetical protein